jgi:hypothetical protein
MSKLMYVASKMATAINKAIVAHLFFVKKQ